MTNNENKRKKDPNWHPDEIKLILLLYFNTDRKWKSTISDRTPEIMALSSILNKINIHPKELRSEKFRSVGSVRMKLTNIRAVDESESIDGLANVSKLDHELFELYSSRKEDLLSECKDILAKKYKKSITDMEKPYFDIIISDKDIFDEFCKKIYESTVSFRQGAVSFKDFKLSQSAMNLSYGLLSELSKYFNCETGLCVQETEKKSETRVAKNTSDISRDVKPTAYVRKILEGIISEGISYSELKNFLSLDWSRDNLGISYPLLKVVPYNSDGKKISELTRDEKGRHRYWIETYKIRKRTYIICKEWRDKHIGIIEEYANNRKAKAFTTVDNIKTIADYLIMEDKNEVSIKLDRILLNFGNEKETIEIVNEFKKIGILKKFDKSGNEFVVEDYDMLHDILENPKQYILK